MGRKLSEKTAWAPSPMAGLALGIASLGWSWENGAALHGMAQTGCAIIASCLLLILAIKYLSTKGALANDMAHPVVGSVVPTFAMALMAISNAVGLYWHTGAVALWFVAIALHLFFMAVFFYHRFQNFQLGHMVPSWFVPPIGIVVADVAFPGGDFLVVANAILVFGMVSYAIMLPLMIYRLVYLHEVPDPAKPTIAIMAAPASLCLAGYLSVTASPSPVIIALLFGIAILMTVFIYLSFFKLLRLPFSPGFAAFTFPMVIGATALFKVAKWMMTHHDLAEFAYQVRGLAMLELFVATGIVGFVAYKYLQHFMPSAKPEVKSLKASG
ncbi:TDT family transporter [Polycladidibacter stylochi]|uniref:TDT family transporter n=1 Tax=Polycladidibacter stylochi TaxID=1807766 RepID=UPI00082A0935|nr:TDT family transporter [Pseudovibrio stylochi]